MPKQKYLMGKLFFTQKYKLQIFLFVLFSVYSLFLSHYAFGANLNLNATWTLNTEPDIREYRLYRTDGTRTLLGTTPHPNNSYPFTVTVPDGSSGTLLFVVTAVDTSNYESADSNQASYSYNLSTTTVTINATDNSATEAGPTTGTFTVSRTGSTSGALTVYYTVSGTATSGSDYSALSGSVIIPVGSSTATITLTPVNDTVVESDETVIVTLSTNASYAVGSPNSATVTITSDDVASSTVTIVATDNTATENPLTTGTFTVSRTGSTSGDLTVYYTVSGTATSGSDYNALSGSVIIPAGSSTTTITVTPINDTLVESDETVIVTLSNNASYAVGSPSSDTVTITSDDVASSTVTIVATDNTATENPLNTGTFTVSRTGSTSGDLTVYYTVSGTATSGSDYSALSGIVTIASGSSTGTITVTPINDTLVESDETVIITLSANASYAVGSPSSATVTITSDDVNTGPFLFSDDFSTDKGWAGFETGGWQRGPAIAGGGWPSGQNGNPDPASDHSTTGDNYILGFAIGADYPNDLIEKSIISPPIDCTGQSQVFLKFWRYINVQSNYYDHARIDVSSNGTNWTQLWENPVFDLLENQWTPVVFDISSVAANQGTVYIKFAMGPTNSSGRFSGWNIDDLEVTSNTSGPMALHVPYNDVQKPNIDELLIQNGFGIKHSSEIPSDMSNYKLLILSSYDASDPVNNPNAANYIKNFVQNGGGAIIMGGTPNLLGGDIGDLSTISDWFGAGWYGNDGGYGTVAIPNPFGTDLLVNDKIEYSKTNCNCAASVDNLDSNTTLISKWATYGKVHSFTHNFGQGRVFYYAGSPGYSEDYDPVTIENGLILLEAGLLWAANFVFSDVPSGYWAFDYIASIYNAGITTGLGGGRYGPEDLVTREQMAAFIIRAVEGEPPLNYCDTGSLFTDVTPDMWSCRYTKRLKEIGITIGYSDGRYGPEDLVTRDQMATFIVRAVEGEPPLNYCDTGSLFTDVTRDMWSCRYIRRLKELGITTGYGDGRYGPYDFVTRAQMAAFLARTFLGMK